jgi:hypothetical protein
VCSGIHVVLARELEPAPRFHTVCAGVDLKPQRFRGRVLERGFCSSRTAAASRAVTPALAVACGASGEAQISDLWHAHCRANDPANLVGNFAPETLDV